MNLSKLPPSILLYGDPEHRGNCPVEDVEQATFFNRLRAQYPNTWGAIGLHIKNEGKRHYLQMSKQRASGGFVTGASDIIVPGSPTFVCEMKRKNHTLSKWQDGQIDYLLAAQQQGAWVCVAFGADAAWAAFKDYLKDNGYE